MNNTILKNLDNYFLYLFILVLPIFLYSQNILAVSMILVIFFTKLVISLFTQKLSFSTGSFDLPVILIVASYLLSTIFITPDKMNAILFPGTTTLIILSSITYLLINQLGLNEKKNINYFLFAGIILYSVLTLLSATKLIDWFNPEGGYFASILYISGLLPLMFNVFFKQTEFAYKFLVSICIFISVFALTISAIITFPKSNLRLSFQESTNIALESVKQSPFLGAGSGNYLESFNKYRSIEFNKSQVWTNKFDKGWSFLLTNLTENGVIGTMAFLALFVIFIDFANKTYKQRKKVGWGILGSLDFLTVIFIFVTLILFPGFPILIFTLFIALGLSSESKKHEYLLPSKAISIVITLPGIVLVSLIGYKIYIMGLAEYKYTKGLSSLKENKAKESYDNLKLAVNLNSNVDRYHKILSSVNFGIANALAKNEALNDNEKEQVTLFVQESINEAKASVSLNNRSSENWGFLGKTYHLLIPFASGADKFALESYKEAIKLDPINPILRIQLGEVYMIQKDYKNAIETFKLAVLAKDDHPNAHFNLALAYKENDEIDKAKEELTKTLSLIDDSESEDYKIAKKELDFVNSPTPVEIESEPQASPSAEIDLDPEVTN